jgi:squalene cyclase
MSNAAEESLGVRAFRTVRTLTSEVGRDLRGRRTTPRADEVHLGAAIDWLYESQDATESNGSAAAYNLVLGWQEAFPETTGYIIETLYDYAAATSDREAAARADRMAEWLLPLQNADGSFPGYSTLRADVGPMVFDTGMVTFGMVRQFRETDEDRFLDAARRACEWLVNVQHPDGHWTSHSYNDARHTYAARVSWAMLETADETGETNFRAAARRQLEWVCSQQRANGWFVEAAFDRSESTFLHTIAYTIRGLLESDEFFEDDDLFRAAKRTADRLLALQRGSGPLAGAFDASWNGADYHCLTGNVQMALVWLRVYERTSDERYLRAATEAIEFVKTTQVLDGPATVRGGVKGSLPVWGRYMYLRYPNWAAKFLVDALLYKRHVES